METLSRYALAAGARPGDVVAVAETPLAVMQGRYLPPAALRPSLLALLGCRLFGSAASCSSACCLQARDFFDAMISIDMHLIFFGCES